MLRRQKFGLAINRRPAVAEKDPDVTEAPVASAVRRRRRIAAWVSTVLIIGAAVPVALFVRSRPSPAPEQSIPFIGLYDRSLPLSYSGVAAFTKATGVKPDMLMYYSSWNEPFQVSFATTAAEHGELPLVQINPYDVSLTAIASGQYDSYLSAYAAAVRSYRHPVVVSFGHEMNGHWYPWANTHSPPSAFVAAWRHIVTLFREVGARNVTWLWTVNIIVTSGNIPSPDPWWPGSSYVTWVGIDGYYYNPSLNFASLFGPTITAVRELTGDPILIAETAAAPAADQSAKIADLFQGVRLYGLLGFVWFSVENYRISRPDAIAAFHQGAEAYLRPAMNSRPLLTGATKSTSQLPTPLYLTILGSRRRPRGDILKLTVVIHCLYQAKTVVSCVSGCPGHTGNFPEGRNRYCP